MKLVTWLKSLSQTEPPASSRMVHEQLKAPQLSSIKKPNAFDRTVDAILAFLDLPQNTALKQEILQDAANFDFSLVVEKLQKAMQRQVSTDGLLWHGRDFGEALRDAIHEIKKTGIPAPLEEQGQMDVVLETVGDKKVVVVQMLRRMTDCDLKRAMEIVDHLPAVIMNGVPPSKAASAQKAFEESGAKVSLRPSQTT